MDESTEPEETMYSIHNEDSIQGQVIGNNATVHQHFYAPGANTQPLSTLDQAWNIPSTAFNTEIMTRILASFITDPAKMNVVPISEPKGPPFDDALLSFQE